MSLGPAKLTDLDDPLRGPQPTAAASAPKRASRPRRQAQGERASGKRDAGATTTQSSEPPAAPTEPPSVPTADEAVGDPYAGSPKIAVNMRATKELWDHLGALTRELEAEGFRTSRTELTEALWHFHSPRDAAGARELVRRYRRARIG
jgi:hypothetical protein